MPDENGTGRLDRIERALELLIADREQFRVEHKRLLTAQILTNDQVQKLTAVVADLARTTDERFNAVSENLNTLIRVVDDMVRNRPRSVRE
jgi:hypothetical protein